MRRRVPVQPLRGSSITELEIQVEDLLRKPLGQIAPVNICDLFALAALEALPGGFEKALGDFTTRIGQEIADIPDGHSWGEFVGELQDLPPARVPSRFRSLLSAELERDKRNLAGFSDLLEAWKGVESKPFDLGEQEPVIETPKAPAASSSTRSTRSPRKTTSKAAAKPVDPEREALVKRIILERVNGRLENGLKEAVLVAGVRHRAKQEYPDILPSEIISLLKRLKETGQLHYSAGRWKRSSAW